MLLCASNLPVIQSVVFGVFRFCASEHRVYKLARISEPMLVIVRGTE